MSAPSIDHQPLESSNHLATVALSSTSLPSLFLFDRGRGQCFLSGFYRAERPSFINCSIVVKLPSHCKMQFGPICLFSAILTPHPPELSFERMMTTFKGCPSCYCSFWPEESFSHVVVIVIAIFDCALRNVLWIYLYYQSYFILHISVTYSLLSLSQLHF